MVYIPPLYPSTIPVTAGGDPDLPDRQDDIDWLYAARYNELKKELIAIMGELGTLPKGYSADVKTRLLAINPSAGILKGDNVVFPETVVPSADDTTLDDYREKAWTPAYTGSTGSLGSLAYGARVGTYIKIGKEIHLKGTIVLTHKGSWTGQVQITGLPETPIAGQVGGGYFGNLTYDGQLSAHASDANYVRFIISKSATATATLQTTGVANNSVFVFHVSYQMA